MKVTQWRERRRGEIGFAVRCSSAADGSSFDARHRHVSRHIAITNDSQHREMLYCIQAHRRNSTAPPFKTTKTHKSPSDRRTSSPLSKLSSSCFLNVCSSAHLAHISSSVLAKSSAGGRAAMMFVCCCLDRLTTAAAGML